MKREQGWQPGESAFSGSARGVTVRPGQSQLRCRLVAGVAGAPQVVRVRHEREGGAARGAANPEGAGETAARCRSAAYRSVRPTLRRHSNNLQRGTGFSKNQIVRRVPLDEVDVRLLDRATRSAGLLSGAPGRTRFAQRLLQKRRCGPTAQLGRRAGAFDASSRQDVGGSHAEGEVRWGRS